MARLWEISKCMDEINKAYNESALGLVDWLEELHALLHDDCMTLYPLMMY